MDARTSKENYYLNIADAVLNRSTCLRRKYGAIIVRNDEIISTGYNGAPRGRVNCTELGRCTRDELGIPSGQRYELCRSVHAEANAIISAARRDIGHFPASLVFRRGWGSLYTSIVWEIVERHYNVKNKYYFSLFKKECV